MDTWATDYTNNTVDYSSVGSGAGITDITDKTVNFGATDAPLSPTQQAAITTKGGVDTIPESAGAAVPVYNLPSVSATLKFTGAILAGIYLGQITNWNNSALQLVNPGVTLPNACIIVVHRSDGSGTSFVWTSFLSKENQTWNKTVGFGTSVSWPVGIGSKGNSGVTATVKSTVDAIGYVDINYALTNGVAFGAVQNPAGNFIVASLTNIASAIADSHVTIPAANGSWYNVSVENAPGANDYPLATLTYVLVYQNESAAGYSTAAASALVDFLHWVVTVGQTYAAELYYVPLPSAIVTSDLTTISAIVT
jgi:phosphate ABC transporter phosphate-binding protein